MYKGEIWKDDQPKKIALFITFCLLLVGAIFLLGFRIIPYHIYSYEYELGKLKPDMLDQGIVWIGIGSVKQINNQFMNFNTKVDASTKDMQSVDFNINVKLKIKKEKSYNFFLDYPSIDSFQNYLTSKIHEKSKTILFKYDAEELLDKRIEISKTVLSQLEDMDGIEYFEISDFAISNIEYSEEFDKILERKAQVFIEREIITNQKENMELMRQNIDLLNTEDYLRYQIAEKWDGSSSLIISDRFMTTSVN